MRRLATLLVLFLAAPAFAEPPRALPPPQPIPPVWNPAAQYITAGQDEPGYRSWYLAVPARAVQVRAFNEYLATYQVAGIVPTWQLLRTATSWQECGGQPFEVPPTEEWPHIVWTLRYVHDYVIPALGPVEPVSGYRNPSLNTCAGGAPESAHKHYSAIDLVPLNPTTRLEMMRTLCGIHNRHGAEYSTGLGFYAFLRFHVDSTKYRRWNMDPAVAAECPPIIHPTDIATVAQPIRSPQPDAGAEASVASHSPEAKPESAPAVVSAPAIASPSPERGNPQER